jgi:hypothetical protein
MREPLLTGHGYSPAPTRDLIWPNGMLRAWGLTWRAEGSGRVERVAGGTRWCST